MSTNRRRPPLRTVLRHLLRGETRWTEVRLEPMPDDWEPQSFEPPIASEHDRLLDELSAGTSSWASQALSAFLLAVRDHRWIEPIAIADAWVESAGTFCIVYTPPWGPPLAAVRAKRGTDPEDLMLPSSCPDEDDDPPSDDPLVYAGKLVDDVSEPLGSIADRLRYDAAGVGWWGSLEDDLPVRPTN